MSYENDKEDYFDALRSYVELDLKSLDCIRHIIHRNVEKGLLPNYTLNIMNMKSQYNTIGIIGIYETLQKYGMTYKDELGYTHYTEDGIEFAKQILETIHEVKDEFAKDKNYMINIEQIPGERAACILMEKDKLFFPDEEYELPLYGNQWIPLGVKTSIDEKVRLSAILDEACNGGSIAHINIDAPFNNFETAWDMLNYVADAGVTYFAFNLRISACEQNHGFYGDVCPICGKPKVTSYQRIVGFLTPERTYSKERKAEFFETLVVDLLIRMGYGGSRTEAGQVVGKSGDGGIDGIIKEDQLGFSSIYIQAKQWAPDTTISRPEIQKFAGALQEQKAQKGLFISTATFSPGARKSADAAGIVLVDGKQLTRLMIKFNLGVSVEHVYEVKRLDTDFFIDGF